MTTEANVVDLHDWKRMLSRKKNGEVRGDERNVKIALENAPELRDIVRYDAFRDRIELLRPLPDEDSLEDTFPGNQPILWSDVHVTELTIWLLAQGFVSLRRNVVQDAVIFVAFRNSVHPVQDYLNRCYARWDKKPRLQTWLKTYLGAKDHAAYLEAVGPKFLIGAVARIFRPGCKMDNILVLEGEQGRGKSTVVTILGRQWAYDVSGDLASKDAAIGIQNVWIGEMAELTGLKRGDQETVKSFISRAIDHYRPPYGRNNVERPRHTVFIATTNETDYLQDPTGARRIWPVECSLIDLAALERDVEHLWGEAMALYLAKQPWHLSENEGRRAAIEQATRQRSSPADMLVLEYADQLVNGGVKRLEMRQLLAEVFGTDSREDPAKAGHLAMQAARALVREGWKRLPPTGRGHKRVQAYLYLPPPEPEDPPQSPPPSSQASQAAQAEIPDVPDDDIPF